MASEAILKQKQVVIDEIKGRVEAAKTIVLFDYRGITDSEAKELRCKLREANADYIERLCTPVKAKRLSQSALEVLAIVAYKQPVTKGEIEAIRKIFLES